MKKAKLLTLLPLLGCVMMVTSCAEHIGNSLDHSKVEEAIKNIEKVDYRSEIKNITYLKKETYKTHFDYTLLDEEAALNPVWDKNVIINETTLTRLDFSNENDLYFYTFSELKCNNIAGFDLSAGRATYAETIARYGHQFYFNTKINKYVYERITGSVRRCDDLQLDKYTFIDPAKGKELEKKLSAGKGTLEKADAIDFFNNYIVKVVESEYRINTSVVDTLEKDGTKAYDYYASADTFSVRADAELNFNGQQTIENDDPEATTKYKGETKDVLAPIKIYVKPNLAFDYTMDVKKAGWAETESVEGTAKREVELEYGLKGWLTHAKISDLRSKNPNLIYDLPEGCNKFITSLYLSSLVNQENMPHPISKTK